MKTTSLVRLVAAALAVALAAPTLAAEVDRRERRQQERIGQGVASGQLTPGETRRLERQEGHIDRQIARDRAAHGGHLTSAERRQINREQDRESARIHRAKHNARHP